MTQYILYFTTTQIKVRSAREITIYTRCLKLYLYEANIKLNWHVSINDCCEFVIFVGIYFAKSDEEMTLLHMFQTSFNKRRH